MFCLKKKRIFCIFFNFKGGGCKSCKYELNKIHPIKKITYKENYLQTKRREYAIKKKGYNLVVMWECEFDEILKNTKYE